MPPERKGRGVPPGGGAGGPARQFCPPTPGDSRGAPGEFQGEFPRTRIRPLGLKS